MYLITTLGRDGARKLHWNASKSEWHPTDYKAQDMITSTNIQQKNSRDKCHQDTFQKQTTAFERQPDSNSSHKGSNKAHKHTCHYACVTHQVHFLTDRKFNSQETIWQHMAEVIQVRGGTWANHNGWPLDLHHNALLHSIHCDSFNIPQSQSLGSEFHTWRDQ